MKYVIYACGIAVISFWIHTYQVQIQLEKYVYNSINYALKHAVHDAALFLNYQDLADGLVVFDQVKGHEAFIETMTRNLPLDDQLRPLDTTLIKEPVQVIEKFFVDEKFHQADQGLATCSPLGSDTFPCQFEFKDPIRDLSFERIIHGPSVVYIIDILAFGTEKHQQYITIQEYKGILSYDESI